MQFGVILVVLFTLCFVSTVNSQAGNVPFCVYYATAVTGGNQVALINATINAAIQGLVTDSRTLNWFNGINNNAGKNFSAPAHAADLTTLHDHLVGFFGQALGCNDSAFSTGASNTGPFNPSLVAPLNAVHSKKNGNSGNFVLAVTAVAFDAFNEIVTGFLLTAGVAPADLSGVSGALTGSFRSANTGASSTNIVCQDSSNCDSSFEVGMISLGFTPSKIVIDSGYGVGLTTLSGSHNVLPAANQSAALACTASSQTAYTGSIPASALPIGNNYFIDSLTCSTAVIPGTKAGYLTVTVVAPATTTPSTSPATQAPPPSGPSPSGPSPSTNTAVGKQITFVGVIVLVLALLFV